MASARVPAPASARGGASSPAVDADRDDVDRLANVPTRATTISSAPAIASKRDTRRAGRGLGAATVVMSSRLQVGEHDKVVAVVAVVWPGAGDEAQRRCRSGPVHGCGGEGGLAELGHAVDDETRDGSVGPSDDDLVAGTELREPVEDGRTRVRVDVAEQHARARCARHVRPLVPADALVAGRDGDVAPG